jgi:hypothetical protein
MTNGSMKGESENRGLSLQHLQNAPGSGQVTLKMGSVRFSQTSRYSNAPRFKQRIPTLDLQLLAKPENYKT